MAYQDAIPVSYIVPGTYVKNTTSQNITAPPDRPIKTILIGQRTSEGTIDALVPKLVVGDAEPEGFWGRGSQLADMFYAYRKINRITETWGIALDDDGAAVAAEWEITFTGNTTQGGTYNFLLGEKPITFGVPSGSTPTQTAAAFAAEVQKYTNIPVSATSALGVTTLVMRWAGES